MHVFAGPTAAWKREARDGELQVEGELRVEIVRASEVRHEVRRAAERVDGSLLAQRGGGARLREGLARLEEGADRPQTAVVPRSLKDGAVVRRGAAARALDLGVEGGNLSPFSAPISRQLGYVLHSCAAYYDLLDSQWCYYHDLLCLAVLCGDARQLRLPPQ